MLSASGPETGLGLLPGEEYLDRYMLVGNRMKLVSVLKDTNRRLPFVNQNLSFR